MKPEITFIVERLPKQGSSGAESYNHYICELLVDLGYDINIIITGDYFPSPYFSIKKQAQNLLFKTIKYVHYKSIWGIAISTSYKSYLRPIKKILSNTLKRGKAQQSSKHLKIGRFISTREAQICKKLIGATNSITLFDTIFRYHETLQSIGTANVLIAHDVFSQRTTSFSNQGFTVSPHINLPFEKEVWTNFDLLVAINEDENQYITNTVSNLTCTIFPSYIGNTLANHKPRLSNEILYIGANAHHNIHGLKHFLNEIWPQVLDTCPTAKLNIIGSIADSFKKVDIPNVEFLGKVEDLTKVAKKCSFSINPVYMGSGVKIKILDYLSLGLPCITTPVGMMGFTRTTEMPILEAKDDLAFVDSVINWLTTPKTLEVKRQTISSYIKLFSPETGANIISKHLQEINHCDH